MSMRNGGQRIVLLGAAGTGMQGLAHILAQRGHYITASDANFDELRRVSPAAYSLIPEDEAQPFLKQANLVIYSDALAPDHPLRAAARDSTIRCLSYQQAVGTISSEYRTVAVAGTHGKSSTAALLGFIAVEAGLDPTVLLGAPMPAWNNAHARAGASSLFIVEADEYRDHFLLLAPTHAVVTSIDFDHPDYFDSLAHVTQSFQRFLQKLPAAGTAITLTTTAQTAQNLTWPRRTLRVNPDAAVLVPALPGAHMQHNAQLAIAAAQVLGVAQERARQFLQRFPGLGRRLETLGNIGAMTVISDYGHHPTEIAATLRALTKKYPTQKITVLFEPHTAERVETFFDAFVKVLAQAPVHEILICPTFQAQGRGAAGDTSSTRLASALQKITTTPVSRVARLQHIQETLQTVAQHADILIAFTAGALDSTLRRAVHPPPVT